MVVKDNKGASSDPANVTITVKHVNHPPVANAGQNQTVDEGYAVSLNGSASRDPDGDPLTYSWKQIGGPMVKLNDTDTPIATFTAPPKLHSYDTNLVFKLKVTDTKNATNSATVKVTDQDIPAPIS
ncbi:MAG: PKD domain-containing protein [Nitrososphaeraceae archaeon]